MRQDGLELGFELRLGVGLGLGIRVGFKQKVCLISNDSVRLCGYQS